MRAVLGIDAAWTDRNASPEQVLWSRQHACGCAAASPPDLPHDTAAGSSCG